jgi:hypothetical protein
MRFCGVLVALAVNMIRSNYEEKGFIKLDEDSSKKVGQELRKLIHDEITSEAFWKFLESSLIDPIPEDGSPTKLSGGDLDANLDLDHSEDSDSCYSESGSEEAEEKIKNSLEESFTKGFSKINLSQVNLCEAAVTFLGTHDDDSSDEEDTKKRLKEDRCAEEACERFLNPRIYYSDQEYPVTKQKDGNYNCEILQTGLSWQDINLLQCSILTDRMVSYIYFGPRDYNKPRHDHLSDHRVLPFIPKNYEVLRASFHLHYKGIEALYEDRISEKYYIKNSKQLSSSGQLEKLKAEVGSSINKALNTLVLSVKWKGGLKTGMDNFMMF